MIAQKCVARISPDGRAGFRAVRLDKGVWTFGGANINKPVTGSGEFQTPSLWRTAHWTASLLDQPLGVGPGFLPCAAL